MLGKLSNRKMGLVLALKSAMHPFQYVVCMN